MKKEIYIIYDIGSVEDYDMDDNLSLEPVFYYLGYVSGLEKAKEIKEKYGWEYAKLNKITNIANLYKHEGWNEFYT